MWKTGCHFIYKISNEKRRKKEQAKLKKIKFKTHPTHAQTNNEMKNFFFDNKKNDNLNSNNDDDVWFELN